MVEDSKVLIIYTGGTIGMVPSDKDNALSPLVVATWEQLTAMVPGLVMLPVDCEVHQMEPIDSSDMHPEYWVDIARVIRDKYSDYGGFVILHGTDTMTYTATALSFLLQNLAKPVIITGSQLPICDARNDAVQNLVTSLMFAAPKASGLELIPEVCIYFNDVLLRGNRSRKVSSSGYAGFTTPNYEPLAEVGEHIKVNTKMIRKPSDKGFFINEILESNVLVFDIFPGIKPEMLRRVFSMDGLKGIVFRTYGAGNAPTDAGFLDEIEKAVNNGLAIVNITQCNQGTVEMGLYDASAGLLRAGVISGMDMTPEAGLVKMMFLLGQGYDVETVKELMQKDMQGEQSLNVYNFIYGEGGAEPASKMAPNRMAADFDVDNVFRACIRFDSVTLAGKGAGGKIELAVFMNYPSADESTDVEIPQCLGVLTNPSEDKPQTEDKPQNLIRDCTPQFTQVVDTNRPIQITVVSRNGQKVKWEGAYLSVYTNVAG